MNESCPIFIVSLKKDTDRRTQISYVLSSQALPFTIVDAIEGSKLTHNDIAGLKYPYYDKPYGKPNGMNEIACSLSHQSIYQHIIKNDIEWALILEDDVIIDKKLSPLIKALEQGKSNLLKKDYVYLLGGQEGLNSRKRISLSFFNKITIANVTFRLLTYSPDKIFRTCCYLIHRSTCERIIAEFARGFFVADSWGLLYKKNAVKGYYLAEIIKHPIVTAENSNLEADREKYFIKAKRRKRGNFESALAFILLQIRRFYRSLIFWQK
ncbi:glycosyltransferase family 25 protein [Arsenophonus sp. aPb]|uniref:glycosyltransferase family 25 protein n=1 Tax=Arsenophonus sp. aPb TaxID=3041619 RepID=UPI0024692B90|nr:glycosyltransferase family 25 protein [Arsenophonus sp. aPb]WGL99445.1 glycosyltransferase family 25 protein [Arsenophonus sp. aPb]